eukprot:TRINITY_DN4165_c0_g1_i1.p1 TRINITY_DN4165_c0_g1~~TRINITY_DN4165_c0_g1_i1.p1  ORF type:complete len:142 (-),score=19.37 TRINITY_DN4165_c0_g1_i1:146-571(-)
MTCRTSAWNKTAPPGRKLLASARSPNHRPNEFQYCKNARMTALPVAEAFLFGKGTTSFWNVPSGSLRARIFKSLRSRSGVAAYSGANSSPGCENNSLSMSDMAAVLLADLDPCMSGNTFDPSVFNDLGAFDDFRNIELRET